MLAEHFLEQLPSENGRSSRRLATAARQALLDHAWPGNVRELRNSIQRASLVAHGDEIEPGDLGIGSRRSAAPRRPATRPPPVTAAAGGDERHRIEAALVDCGGVVSKAAASLGMSRQALYRKMEQLGIVLERRLRS